MKYEDVEWITRILWSTGHRMLVLLGYSSQSVNLTTDLYCRGVIMCVAFQTLPLHPFLEFRGTLVFICQQSPSSEANSCSFIQEK
jgi:hypothetical protein